MDDYLEYEIEKLSLSKTACEELKKCNINTIQDLMSLINKFISRKESKAPQSYNIGIKDAVISIFKNRPNEILNYEEIRDNLINKYGDDVSNNINSIKSVTSSLACDNTIKRASAGQYFYPSNDEIIRKTKHQYKKNRQPNTPLMEAVPEILKTINGPFNYKIIREELRKKYGNEVSTKKSSIKATLNQLLRDGFLKHTESGDYIRCQNI